MTGRTIIPDRMRHEYEAYINSAEWKKRRQRVIELAGFCCERCGATAWDKRLEVHHLTYERLGHELDSDLVALCPQCHVAADRERANRSQTRSYLALQEKRLDGWASKKYGDDWADHYDSDVVAAEFESWLEWRGEA